MGVEAALKKLKCFNLKTPCYNDIINYNLH